MNSVIPHGDLYTFACSYFTVKFDFDTSLMENVLDPINAYTIGTVLLVVTANVT